MHEPRHVFSEAERAAFEFTIRSAVADPLAAAELLADPRGAMPRRAEHVVGELSALIRDGADRNDRVLVMRMRAAQIRDSKPAASSGSPDDNEITLLPVSAQTPAPASPPHQT